MVLCNNIPLVWVFYGLFLSKVLEVSIKVNQLTLAEGTYFSTEGITMIYLKKTPPMLATNGLYHI